MGVALSGENSKPSRRWCDVPPADLIGQPELVVAGGIELIEGAAGAVDAALVAGGEVVFRRQLDGAGAGQRLAHLPVAGPGADRVVGQRAALQRHLDAVVEPGGQLAGRAGAHRGLVEAAEGAELAAQVLVVPHEDVRLDRRLREQLRGGGVGADQPVAVAALVEAVGQAAHERRREDVDLKRLVRGGSPRAASHVRPVFTHARCPSSRCSPKASS